MNKVTIKRFAYASIFSIALSVIVVLPALGAPALKYYCSNQVFKAFEKEKMMLFTQATGIGVDVKNASSGTCVYALMNGYCDIASTARAIGRRHQDYGYREIPFALDPIVVIVSADCAVDNLTEKQIQDIFSGDIVNWKEVGGPDLQIRVIVPSSDTAANKNFRRQVMKLKDLKHDFMAYDSTDVIEAVKHFPCGAISFISRGAALHDPAVKTVAVNGIKSDEKDYPYFQIFYYIVKGEPTEAVKSFIDFTFSDEGQKIMKKYGIMPVEK